MSDQKTLIPMPFDTQLSLVQQSSAVQEVLTGLQTSPEQAITTLQKLFGKHSYLTDIVITRIAEGGAKVPVAHFMERFPDVQDLLNITTEYVSGPTLALVLRDMYRRYLQSTDIRGLFNQIALLSAMSDRQDWAIAGYSSESAYLEAVQPFNLDRATISSLVGFYRRALPRIMALHEKEKEKEEGQYTNPVTLFSVLPRTSIVRLASVLANPSLDNDGLRLICRWAVLGGLSQSMIDTLAASVLVTEWSQVAKKLRDEGIDPYDRLASLGDVGRDGRTYVTVGIEKAILAAKFLMQSETRDIQQLLDEMAELPLEACYRMFDTPHARSSDFDLQAGDISDDEEGDEEDKDGKKPAKVEESFEAGHYDTHSPMILYVRDVGDGFFEVVRGSVPASVLAALSRTAPVELRDAADGDKPFFFGKNLKVVKKK